MGKGRVHLQDPNVSGRLEALCGGYSAPGGLPIGDLRLDRFVRDEDRVTCRECRSKLREPVSRPPARSPSATYVPRVGARVAADLPPERDRPRAWPTWQAALRALVLARDVGEPLPIIELDPRMPRMPPRWTADGDRAQRASEHLAGVAFAYRHAFESHYRREDGSRVSEDTCRTILVSVIVGERVYIPARARVEYSPSFEHAGDVRPKSRIVTRQPRTISEIAHAFGLDEGEVRGIVGEGVSRFKRHLQAAGLVSGAMEEDMPRIGKNDLDGWEAIAEAIGRSTKTAMRAAVRDAADDPLPVGYQGRGVVASSAELAAWIERETAREAARRRTG